MSESKLRYEVGKTYYFMHVEFTMKTPRFGSLYFPWEDTLQEIRIVKLVCDSHHKVRGDYDGKDVDPQYDGFIFKDENGGDWYNQYPTASYGQLSDAGDRMVSYHKPETEDDWRDYILVSDAMSTVLRGIRDLAADPEKAKALEGYFDQLKTKLHEAYGVTVEVYDNIREFINTKTGLPDSIDRGKAARIIEPSAALE